MFLYLLLYFRCIRFSFLSKQCNCIVFSVSTATTSMVRNVSGNSVAVVRSSVYQANSSPIATTDTPTANLEAKSSSPAANVLRPRFGKEYTVPDRKRLVEEFGSRLSSRASISTMFTFEIPGLTMAASAASSGTNSPQSPSNVGGGGGRASTNITPPLPAYLLAQRFAASEFGSLPGSPRYFAQESPPQPPLNYIQLDYSGVADARSAVPRPASAAMPTVAKSSGVDYAIIDMVATAVSSRVGREHVKQREDALRARLLREESNGRERCQQPPSSDCSPRSKLSKNSSHLSLVGGGGGGKDRKHSLISRDSRGSADQRRQLY